MLSVAHHGLRCDPSGGLPGPGYEATAVEAAAAVVVAAARLTKISGSARSLQTHQTQHCDDCGLRHYRCRDRDRDRRDHDRGHASALWMSA